ncbi:MAG: hypothetical protein DWQ04_30530 [Chloroflexi bacterium]|nr:MAG: hypothetical protein DWQ04_30530 [Chloroflexota bacterium]
MFGVLSRLPLAVLLQAGVDVVGVVVPANRVPPFLLEGNGRFPTPITPVQPPQPTTNLFQQDSSISTLELAAQHQIPAFGVRHLQAEATLNSLRALSPDVICVSCFPQKLPPVLLQLPRLGCLNLHPSLLPHFRGPAPLFWTFQRGVSETGVTIHWMDEAFDTGDIALQKPLTLPDGISNQEAEQLLAKVGGDLMVDALQRLANNNLPRKPQPAGFAADPLPRDADFELNLNWSARRAFNFMRGTGGWKRPYVITINNQLIKLQVAIDFQPHQILSHPIATNGNQVIIQLNPGVLFAV